MSSERELEYGPWNPGLESALPEEFLPLSTVFSTSNATSSLDEVRALSGVCGIAIEKLSAFKPERLALHEVLIRVMADLTVPDGLKYEDLGVNFRQMTAAIFEKGVAPIMPEIRQAFDQLARDARALIDRAQIPSSSAPARRAAPKGVRWPWSRRVGSHGAKSAGGPSELRPEERDLATIARWRTMGVREKKPFENACFQALVTVAEAIVGKYGRLINDRSLITTLAARLVCNGYGSQMIGEMIDRHFAEAVSRNSFRFLPAQPHPVVMNVKGASASGKSTMRPLQKKLALRLGLEWTDFALISPDIWRKYLLDYDKLGPARRYAGTLTGHEIEIIDKKLDRYMRSKAEAGRMSHLLIDRFRFDSFAEGPDEEQGGRLLTRFGDEIYMFFMITPPEATVERAWKRGQQIGRYKAVDDLLAHNVEAYSAIPGLFFTWVSRADKRVHVEFLDNSVSEGERPRTVAFGLNGQLNILDIDCLLNIDRYRTINIEARDPASVYPVRSGMAVARDAAFLMQCLRRIPIINLAHRETGQIYARIEGGRLKSWNCDVFKRAEPDEAVRSTFEQLTAPPQTGSIGACSPPCRLDPRENLTLGQWGNGS